MTTTKVKSKDSFQGVIDELKKELTAPVELSITISSGPRSFYSERSDRLARSRVKRVKVSSVAEARKAVPAPFAQEASEVFKNYKALRDEEVKEQIAKLVTRKDAIAAILNGTDITFETFAGLYSEQRSGSGPEIEGLEHVIRSSGYGGYRRSYQNDDHHNLINSLFMSKVLNPENKDAMKEFFGAKEWLVENPFRAVSWGRRGGTNPDWKPGALETKKLRELTPEDCFVKVVDSKTRGPGTKYPMDTTLHSYVRRVLGAAVTAGLIEENPASTKNAPAKKIKVAIAGASSTQKKVHKV